MVIGNSKYTFFDFLPYEYKALEKYLDKMALKGWKLKSMQGKLFRFIKMKPKKIKHFVYIGESTSSFDDNNSDVALEYRECCEDTRWKFICEYKKIQVFYTEEYTEYIDINTDERKKFNNISKLSIQDILITIFTVSTLLFSQYSVTLGGDNAIFLTDDAQLLLLFSLSVLAINEIIGLINYLIWKIRGERALKNNEKVQYQYNLSINFRRILVKIFFLSAIISLMLCLLNENIFILKGVSVIIISIVIASIITEFIKTIIKGRLHKMSTYTIINIIIMIIVMIIIGQLVLNNEFITDEINKNLNDQYVLTLEDFNDKSIYENNNQDINSEDEFNILDEPYINDESSIIAESLFYSDEGHSGELTYEFFRSNFKWVINYKFNKIISSMKKYDLNFEVIKSTLPENIMVYKNNNSYGSRYLLTSENKILQISQYSDNQSESEFLDIIYNEVFK